MVGEGGGRVDGGREGHQRTSAVRRVVRLGWINLDSSLNNKRQEYAQFHTAVALMLAL